MKRRPTPMKHTHTLWKVLGLAAILGAVAAGAVAARRRRTWHDYGSDELRERLHARLGDGA
jgi:hypothetical protein